MLKEHINKILILLSGYQFTKDQSLDYKIKTGKYRWINEFGIRTVIDVGANKGQFISFISKILPEVNIYAFEPIKECYEQLLNNYKDKSLHCYNVALGDKEEKLEFFQNDFTPSSSFLQMEKLHKEAFPHTAKAIPDKIQVITFNSLKDEIIFRPKVLLKIDVQGFEINVLKGADQILNLVDIIFIETSFYELYKGQSLFSDIYNFLSDRGFGFFGNLEQNCNPVDGKILQADSIFIRNNINR